MPTDAVVFESGLAWVFQQLDDGRFEQRPVPTDHAEPSGWFVEKQALREDRPLVVHGAQAILGQKIQAATGGTEPD